MDMWRDIQSMPRNGTLFLAVATKDGGRMRIVSFNEVDDNLIDGQWGFALQYFSHWMPLPDPPADT